MAAVHTDFLCLSFPAISQLIRQIPDRRVAFPLLPSDSQNDQDFTRQAGQVACDSYTVARAHERRAEGKQQLITMGLDSATSRACEVGKMFLEVSSLGKQSSTVVAVSRWS